MSQQWLVFRWKTLQGRASRMSIRNSYPRNWWHSLPYLPDNWHCHLKRNRFKRKIVFQAAFLGVMLVFRRSIYYRFLFGGMNLSSQICFMLRLARAACRSRGVFVCIYAQYVWNEDDFCQPLPIGSMYGIFTYIWLIFMVNVGKYTMHGSYGPMGINHWAREIDHEEVRAEMFLKAGSGDVH